MKFVEKNKVKGPWLDHNICSILQGCLQEMHAVYAAQYVTTLHKKWWDLFSFGKADKIGKKTHGEASGLSILMGKG